MGAPRYIFRTTWTFRAPLREVFDRLRAIEDYPAWWPEVKLVEQISPTTAGIRIRSLLPYDLRFSMQRTVEDLTAGILEVRLEGDLEGATRWTLTVDGNKVHCVFDEDVITNKRALNLITPVARPLFRANHALMMRHGRRGLKRVLQEATSIEPTV